MEYSSAANLLQEIAEFFAFLKAFEYVFTFIFFGNILGFIGGRGKVTFFF